MMTEMAARLSTRATFILVNAAVALALAVGVIWPICTRFGERAEAMQALRFELSSLNEAESQLKALKSQTAVPGDPFLPSADERIGNADLEAILQEKTKMAGARFLSVQSVPMPRGRGRITAAKLDMEGSAAAIETALKQIETGAPLLHVTSSSLRTSTSSMGPGDVLHAEVVVQAALKPVPHADPAPLSLRASISPSARMP